MAGTALVAKNPAMSKTDRILSLVELIYSATATSSGL